MCLPRTAPVSSGGGEEEPFRRAGFRTRPAKAACEEHAVRASAWRAARERRGRLAARSPGRGRGQTRRPGAWPSPPRPLPSPALQPALCRSRPAPWSVLGRSRESWSRAGGLAGHLPRTHSRPSAPPSPPDSGGARGRSPRRLRPRRNWSAGKLEHVLIRVCPAFRPPCCLSTVLLPRVSACCYSFSNRGRQQHRVPRFARLLSSV